MKKNKLEKFERFLLTINNPKETDEEMFSYIKNLKDFRYTIFQREKSESCGYEHFHIYIVFSKLNDFALIRHYFPKAHISIVLSFDSRIYDYCSKLDSRISGPYECGQLC